MPLEPEVHQDHRAECADQADREQPVWLRWLEGNQSKGSADKKGQPIRGAEECVE